MAASELSAVENVADENAWECELSDDAISFVVKGQHATYSLVFSWINQVRTVHCACSFDLRVEEGKVREIHELARLFTCDEWVGHFEFWKEESSVVYRSSIVLPNGQKLTKEQCELYLSNAVQACEKIYPAVHYVLWSELSAEDAHRSVNFETKGSA